MRHIERFLISLSFVLFLACSPVIMPSVIAVSDYIYDSDGVAQDAPPAYELERSIRAEDLGVKSLSSMAGLFIRDGIVYIADTDKIILTDEEFNVKKILTTYEVGGKTRTVNNPSGIFVTTKGDLYVCEPDNSRILQFDSNQKFVRELGKPDIIGLDDVQYKPTKLVVDRVGRLYVIAQNIYEGIIELNGDGSFSRFFGTNQVHFNPLDLFWRSIATEAQRKQMSLWLPTEFRNVAIDVDGFIFTTSKGGNEIKSLKKLNAKGKDILRFTKKMRPQGDISYLTIGYGIPVGASEFGSVDCNKYGMYTVLDTKRMRIFTYNEDGYLLYVFGGNGNVEGAFQNPVDLKFMGEKILVLDQQGQSIEIMCPTIYGKAVNGAVRLQSQNQYEDATAEWKKAAEMNPNLELAYTGIGLAELRLKNNETATNMFRSGNNRYYYSKAFEKYRAEWMNQHFSCIFIGVIVAVILLLSAIGFYRWIHERKRRKMKL